LVFAPRVSKREHLERLRYAHLFLDSFIYNAHSTASDMIWANLPLLTLQGDTFASRVASSLVEVSVGSIACSILVAHSMKEFEGIAVALATTYREKLSTIRAWLAESTLSSRLFDRVTTTSHLEESYKAMVSLAPSRMHIVIDPSEKSKKVIETSAMEHLMVIQTLQKQTANVFMDAEKGYRRLLVLRNNNSDAWHLYGLLHHQVNLSQVGLPLVQQSIIYAPGAGFYRSNYAQMLVSIGEEIEAMEQYAIALHLDPRQEIAFQKLMILFAKYNKHSQLIEAHQRYGFMHSFQDEISEYEYWFQLSFAHAKLNDTTSAMNILENHILSKASTPFNVRIKAQYNVMVHLQKLGQYDKSNDLALQTVLEEHVHNFRPSSVNSIEMPQGSKLIIYCNEYGLSWWPEWGPSSIDQGVGGSEEAVIYLARELAKLGYQVRVYANPKPSDIGMDEYNVSWLHYSSFNISEPIDIFIAWRYHISVALAKSATQTYVWLHDITDGNFFTSRFLSLVTGVLCLSQFHTLESNLPVHEKIIISRNGLSASAFVDGENIPTKFVYGSGPNRGLETILLNWKYLRSAIPNATLDVFYGFTPAFVKFAQPSAAWRSQMENLLQQEGIAYHGLVDHARLATAYANAGFYLYPTQYPETSCVSIMKAMAAGAIPITSKRGALAEVAGAFDLGPQELLEEDPNGQWALHWLNSVIDAVHKADLQEHRIAMKEFARKQFLWANIALEWQELFNLALRT
ncbi:UDP-N-acetylglucosamine-peptide N-acetylglucosaminyltransferase, partial [Thraustotheca clavata]